MSETLVKYSCPSCGAPLRFDANSQKIVCDSCDSTYTESYFDDLEGKEKELDENQPPIPSQEKIDWKTEGFVERHEKLIDVSGYSCNGCGAQIAADATTVATECMYCGNALVVNPRIDGMLKPDIIIPFKIDKTNATELLKNFYKGKKLLPKEFLKENRISKIAGMYVPFWLFSCQGTGKARYKGTRVSTRSDSNYIYTTTRTYALYREGNLSFDNITIDASKKLQDNYMDGIEPYNFEESVKFDDLYMAGYFADKFDVDVSESAVRAGERVMSTVESQLASTISGYNTTTTDYKDIQMVGEEIQYALLPVWMLNTNYKGKMYQFAINGQTGRVSGELPVDKAKLALYSLGTFFATLIPATIIAGMIL